MSAQSLSRVVPSCLPETDLSVLLSAVPMVFNNELLATLNGVTSLSASTFVGS
ncbi:MAG: hypothetical protein ACFB9N_09965 [Geitlerinemataceae cyanobacterium]